MKKQKISEHPSVLKKIKTTPLPDTKKNLK